MKINTLKILLKIFLIILIGYRQIIRKGIACRFLQFTKEPLFYVN